MEVPSTKVIHPTLPVQSVERSSGAVGPSTRVEEGFSLVETCEAEFSCCHFLVAFLGSYLFWVIQITNATFLVFSERPTAFVTGFRRFGSFIASPSLRVPH